MVPELTVGNPICRKAIFPLIFLVLALSNATLYYFAFDYREGSFDGMSFYFALFSTSYVLIILFQRFIDSRRLHFSMSIGWGLIFLGTFEKFLADFTNTPGLENENFTSILIFLGLLLIAFSLYFWAKQVGDNERIRQQQHRVIELYTSLMSHDAGNDLQAVLGYVETALMISEGCSPKTIELLEAAQAASLRMTGLIKAFKPEELDTELSMVPRIQSAAIQAEKADLGLTVNFYVQPDLEKMKVAGASLIQIALANLLRNAAQYAGEEPVVNIKIFRKNQNLIVTITDEGPGIPEEVHDKIFERGKPDAEHGLGLYLTRQIIAACRGSINLEESPVGAAFKIVLPISE